MSPCRDGGGGSSPLARGLREELARERFACRIIPARAGFTEQSFSSTIRLEDHPRSRGVYIPLKVSDVPKAGSSPLARGLPVGFNVQRCILGIIPARAGFTRHHQAAYRRLVDHPRSRGVYLDSRVSLAEVVGSSPLARGLLRRFSNRIRARRIIPARAGFTLADPWNPNDEPCYQTAFTFSANLEPAPPSSGSAVVLRRSTMTPSEA